jgi:hypothetical protein
VAVDEPEVVAVLVRPGTGRVWDAAREGVARLLTEAGTPATEAAVDLVLRWLLTQAVAPSTPEQVRAAAAALAAGLDTTRVAPPGAGLGWPGS